MGRLLLPLAALAVTAAAPVPQNLPTDPAPLIDQLEARLNASSSATAVLQQWCADFHFAEPAAIHADVEVRETVLPDAARRARLGVGDGEPVAYRRVALKCGDRIMSRAENWYVPARLTAEMNAALAADAPFGKVIAALKPSRVLLASERHWAGQGLDDILRQRAVLLAADSGRPIAELVEVYQRGMLAP